MLYGSSNNLLTVYSVLLQALALTPTTYQYITRQASCTSFTSDVYLLHQMFLAQIPFFFTRMLPSCVCMLVTSPFVPTEPFTRLMSMIDWCESETTIIRRIIESALGFFSNASTKRTSIPKLRQRGRIFRVCMLRDCGARQRVCVLVDRQACGSPLLSCIS